MTPKVPARLDRNTRHPRSPNHGDRWIQTIEESATVMLGVTVQHRSRVAKDPTQPNLRQVHLIHEELHDELRADGFQVTPGAIGENITTRGIDLLALPRGARLYIGDAAVIGVTGLRDPCRQLNDYQPNLMATVLGRDEQDNLVRKAGIMGIVLAAGEVRAGDPIRVELPPEQHQRLEPV